MRQSRCKSQSVEDLRDTRPHDLSIFVFPPVACGYLVLKALCDLRGTSNRSCDIKRLAMVNLEKAQKEQGTRTDTREEDDVHEEAFA